MMTLRVYMFGTPRLERHGTPVSVSRRKAMALLAYLSVTNQPHSRDALATLLWPEYDQTQARANLRRDLSRLKEALGQEALAVDRMQVSLHPQIDLWLDVAKFQERLAAVQQHHHPAQLCPDCLKKLEEAVALYTDDFMAGFSLPDSPQFDEWQFFQTESLRLALAEALQLLIQWRSRQGEYEPAIEYGRRWLALDSLHEPAHRCLMQLYAWSGQQAAALRQYQECLRLLDEELGVGPEAATTDLYQAIKARQLAPVAQDLPAPVAAPPAAEPPPQERYVIEELLAAGGHGEVYRGYDKVNGQLVVIKRLRPELVARGARYVARLVREGEMLRKLNHPNIVRVLATFEENGQHHIVMEYVPGGSLRDLLDQGPRLPLDRILNIALELADALSRAHHLDIIHRDLKPANVLLATDGTPRLSDFGVARLLRSDDLELTQTGAILGSPAYMSPEALRGEELDAQSDIWSFGVLLYEMLAGRRPFEGEQITTLLLNILQASPPVVKQVRQDMPAALDDLLQRMLAKERPERIGTMRQVAAELEAIRDDKMAGWRGDRVAGHAPPVTPASSYAAATSSSQTGSHKTPTPTPRYNLPAEATPFIGRESELAALEELLTNPDVRLVTIVGLGGMGKTRLATAVARRLAQRRRLFADGVIFISLAGVETHESLPTTLARSLLLSLVGQLEPMMEVCNYLYDKTMLLVLDNFEQLIDGVYLLNQLLETSDGVKLLVTSREPLRLTAEWRCDVEGLSYPEKALTDHRDQWPLDEAQVVTKDQPYEAVQLFIQAARQVRSDFNLTAETLPHVYRLCQLVAGMPLALKLAATWLRVMPVDRIVDEVSRSIDILTSPLRDIPSRQRSMRAVFEQTWALLLPEEQQAWQALSIFRGGFTQEAAAEVAAVSPYLLMGLVDRALVQVAGSARYEVHELTRQFAGEKLQASDDYARVAHQHSAYYLRLVAGCKTTLRGEMPLTAVTLLKGEIDNIRQAWQWAVAHVELNLIGPAMEPLVGFYELTGLFSEGARVFGEAAQQFDALPPTPEITSIVCRLLITQALSTINHGRGDDVVAILDRAAAMTQELDDELCLADISYVRGLFYEFSQQFDQALAQQAQAVAYYEALNRPHRLVAALEILGAAQSFQGMAEAALQTHLRGVQLATELGNVRRQALAMSYVGIALFYLNRYDEALEQWQQAVSIFEKLQDVRAIVRTRNNISFAYNVLGRYEEALAWARPLLPLLRQTGDHRAQAVVNDTIASIYFALGNYDEARTGYEQALKYAREVNLRLDQMWLLTHLAELDTAMGRYEAAGEWLRQATALIEMTDPPTQTAVTLVALGRLYHRTGRLQEALEQCEQEIDRLRQVDAQYFLAELLALKGAVLLEMGALAEAQPAAAESLELATAIGHQPAIFEARLLLAKLAHGQDQSDDAVEQLRALLPTVTSDPDRAAVYYELWQVRGEPEAARQALALYDQLSARIPNVLYQQRAKELSVLVTGHFPKS